MKPIDLLLPFQRKYVQDASRFKIALWSRQTGKGFTSSFEATADALTNPKSNWIIAAPTERQAMETLDKCKDWARAAAVAVSETEEELESTERGLGIKAKVITFPNKSKIYALPGKPASLRGFSGSLILDEFAFFEDQQAVWKAVYAVITNPMSNIKKVRITSTPMGKGDMFFKLIDENLLNPRDDRKIKWTVHKVTIHDAAKEWEETGRLRGKSAEEYVEEIRAGFDTPEAFPQEFECEFTDGDNYLLPYGIIAGAEHPQASECTVPAMLEGKEIYCGIDFGRVQDYTVCWTLESVAGILWTREVLMLRNMDTASQFEIIKSRIANARRVAMDYTGPGIGFGDLCVNAFKEFKPEAHRFGKVRLCTFSAQFKRLLFPRLRSCFDSPVTLRIPISQQIRDDLHAMRQIVSNGDYTYSAPHTADGHSDRCTALALAVLSASRKAGIIEPIVTPGRGKYESRSITS